MNKKLFLVIICSLIMISLVNATVWVESLNTNLMTYWKFDENSGTNVRDWTDNYDLTTNATNWTTGLINNGLAFNGSGLVAYNDTFLDFNATDLSFSFWFKLDKTHNSTSTKHKALFEKVNNAEVDQAIGLLDFSTGKFLVSIKANATTGSISSNKTNWEAGVWHNIVFIWDGGSNVSLYVNGEHNHTRNINKTFNSSYEQYDFVVGGSFISSAYNNFNGTIDEFGVWNRTLLDSEIVDLYNLRSGISYDVPPNISISTPINNSNLSSTTFDLNYTFVEIYPDSCWYSNNSGEDNSSIVSMGTNWTDMMGVEGSNNRTVYCNDTLNNLNSSIVYFTIDTIYPDINLTYPLNTTYTSIITRLNYTVSDINLDTCWYSLDLGVTNTTITCGDNITGLNSGQGSSTWFVWVNDSANNVNSSNVTFKVIPNVRKISQSFITISIIDRIGSLKRDISEFFTTNFLIDKLGSFFRRISQEINIFPPANKTYDFSGVFSSRAFNNAVVDEPPLSFAPVGETEINYTKINASDNVYATDTSATEHPYHRFEMVVEETDVNFVDVLWEGHTSSTGLVYLYVWNYTANNWSLIDSGSGTTDFNLTARVTDLNNVRQSGGNITFLAQDG